MSIKKRSINSQEGYTDYKHLKSNFNDSNINNPTHQSGLPTNFDLKSITLEDLDRAVYMEFNRRFKIKNRFMSLIILDAELTSMQFQNYEMFDKDKEYLNSPYFTFFRKESIPKYRTNPAYKKVVYVVPKQKANGIVYEEWITEGVLSYDLIYELKFISNFREYTNIMEKEMRHYFRNKRNIIIVNNERFSIGSEDGEKLSELEIINRENIDQKTMYVTTWTLKFECFTRDLSTMQKRERPNKYTFDLTVKDGQITTKDGTINFERFDILATTYPPHPSPGIETPKQPPKSSTNFNHDFNNDFNQEG